MKKNIAIILLFSFLVSCSNPQIEETSNTWNLEKNTEKEIYTVWLKENNFVNVYWNIVNSTLKVISPNISGKISYLNCEPGKKVNPNTLIASISPNFDWQAYQNSSIQVNTLIEQIRQLNEVKTITNNSIDSQKRQILLQKDELKNSKENISNNFWTDETWLKNQLKIVEDSIKLLKQNQKETEEEIKNNEITLKKNIFNSVLKASKLLDETFSISEANSSSNYNFRDFLGSGNNLLKQEVTTKWKEVLTFIEQNDENLSKLSNQEISKKLNDFSIIFKNASEVTKNSLAWLRFPQSQIDALFSGFLGHSDGFITLKNNLEKIENSKQTTKTNFDMKLKELEWKVSSLKTEKLNLKNKENSIWISEKNIDEQIQNLEETRKAKMKDIDLQIIAAENNLKTTGINLESENLYAEVSWTVKQKVIKADWSQVQIWTSICEIIPDSGSLKLEIYSPEKIELGTKFNFYKNKSQIGNGTIIAEYPERNAQTQNYIYEWQINFWELKQWEYLDVKILKESNEDEIWVPITYISPKLDWYYTKKLLNWEAISQKVIIWNMNNWEIQIISGLKKWDVLEK